MYFIIFLLKKTIFKFWFTSVISLPFVISLKKISSSFFACISANSSCLFCSWILFFSVERPEFQKYIIPTSWQAIGLGASFHLLDNKLNVKAHLLNGMNAAKKGLFTEGQYSIVNGKAVYALDEKVLFGLVD